MTLKTAIDINLRRRNLLWFLSRGDPTAQQRQTATRMLDELDR